ncbi:MAG TPA: hypothetical protein VLE89_05720 [Chlamydiales bacterium]|nr:hypothetical protein [Chlamydiales bacterium]
MFLPTLVSSFYLLATAPIPQAPILEEAVQVVRSHHLESADGRLAFLTEELSPFVLAADELNREIQTLALQIQTMEEKEQVIALTDQLTEKMGLMTEMLPTLQTALLIENDLEQLDTILSKDDPLDADEQDLLLRLATLCSYLDARHPSPV